MAQTTAPAPPPRTRRSSPAPAAQPTGLAVQACGDAHLSNFGVFDRTIVRFAAAYAGQNQRDHAALAEAEAAASGRITVESGL